MKEVWKDIKEYEGYYQISSFGRVKSLERITKGKHIRKVNEKMLALNINKDGYIQVNLWKNNKLKRYKTSRLVALHFIKNTQNKPTVNHIDGNKKNNHISNLEWATRKEQSQHAVEIGLIKPSEYNKKMTRKMNVERKSVKVNQIDLKTGKIIKEWNSMSDVKRKLGISVCNISRCCNGKRKSTAGYQWQYVYVKERENENTTRIKD